MHFVTPSVGASLRRLVSPVLALLFVSVASATSYYVDPATGSMTNPGTSASPWSTLEAVFTANKTFVAGDVIYLRDGYHGNPTVKGNPTATVTITAQSGHAPGVRSLTFSNASRWLVSSLKISPETSGTPAKIMLVTINNSCQLITLEDCDLYSESSIAGWTEADWLARSGSAITTFAPTTTIRDNRISNINYGIIVNQEATGSLVSRNTITNFAFDGIRGLSDNSVYEYNLVQNSFAIDDNHDDGFQSWSGGRNGVPVGGGTVSNVVLRGNTFISYTDPAQPFKGRMQGIGCFDGFFNNWTVENNLIVTDQYEGLSFYGATNCVLTNNTVMKNPINAFTMTPWLRVAPHKNGTASSGNTVRNNLLWSMSNQGTVGTVDTNLISTSPTAHFVNYAAFDFDLLSTSTAHDTGSATLAPVLDHNEMARDAVPDIGAFEYAGLIAYEPFDYAATTTVSSAADSASDFGWTGTTWSSSNDVITPGLSQGTLPVMGNTLQFTSNVAASRSLDPAAMPVDFRVLDSDGVYRLGKAGTTLWLSVLLRADGADSTGSLVGGINLVGSSTGGGVKLTAGDVGTATQWAVAKSTTVAASGTAITQNQTVLLVISIKFIAGSLNDEVDLFVDPTLGITPPGTPSAMLRNVDIGTFDRVEFKGSRLMSGDEFTLATNWATAIGR